MTAPSCCAEYLRDRVPSTGRQVVCFCGVVWTGRAGAWVSGGAR